MHCDGVALLVFDLSGFGVSVFVVLSLSFLVFEFLHLSVSRFEVCSSFRYLQFSGRTSLPPSFLVS